MNEAHTKMYAFGAKHAYQFHHALNFRLDSRYMGL